ncbi:MAG: sudA 1 [Ignavibacteria bacterium]|nr:sudA 1 [Ignavibacteria bacterium]
MEKINLKINNIDISVESGTTILNAAAEAGIYIPVMCSHPDVLPFHSIELSDFIYQGNNKIENDPDAKIESVRGCGICLVYNENTSEFLPSCKAHVENGMSIQTETESVKKRRQENMSKILATHPHSCLSCSQHEGCIPMTDICPGNVVFNERCCSLLNNCEFQRVVDYVGIAPETQRYQYAGLPIITDDPLFKRDYNLCISCGRCVRVCQQVKGVYALGAVIHDGKLTIGTVNGPMLDDAECKFCGSCVEVCPTGALMDKNGPRLKSKANFVPCKSGCPGEVDIPQYLRLVAMGKTQEAAEVIASKLPLPSVLGKVCFHPCETDCKHREVSEILHKTNEALSIRLVKDYAMSNSNLPERRKSAPTSKHVSIIGAGPAGLSAAFFLSSKGHKITVYEKEPEIGGMLRYGIPRYRLPLDVLEKDLNWIADAEIDFKTNVTFGKDISLQTLKESSDAIFIAVGLSESRRLPTPGANDENIHDGIGFLNKVAKDGIVHNAFSGKSVVIVGGGNVATDAARCSVRLGAGLVTIVCLEQYDEMPAYKDEIRESEEEGIIFKNGWGIEEIQEGEISKKKIRLIKCSSVFNSNGAFAPQFDESEKEEINCNIVISCIGQKAESAMETGSDIERFFSKGLIKINRDTCETEIRGIYAGGDIASGPASVIDAVGAGRKAARSIDRFLGGDGNIDFDDELSDDFNMKLGRQESFCMLKRIEPDLLDAGLRKNNFDGVEITYSQETAIAESMRCLQCDLRLKLRHNPSPPEKYFKFTPEIISKLPEIEGVIQLLDENKEIFAIKGCDNLRRTALEMFNEGKAAAYLLYDEDAMFTKRESELLQQYLQKHGKMPDSGDDLDDLF